MESAYVDTVLVRPGPTVKRGEEIATLDGRTPVPATAIAQIAATVHVSKVSLFEIADGVAHAFRAKLIGERGGIYYVEPTLPAGTQVATEGRGLLDDKDAVAGKLEPWQP